MRDDTGAGNVVNHAGGVARSHITVRDLTRVRAGPSCCRVLADFCANVIKIDAPDGMDRNTGVAGSRLIPGGPKLFCVDLTEDEITEVFYLPTDGEFSRWTAMSDVRVAGVGDHPALPVPAQGRAAGQPERDPLKRDEESFYWLRLGAARKEDT